MYILDTNVLSGADEAQPAQTVLTWLRRHGADDLRTSAICQAEILAGTAILPEGRRKQDLEAGAARVFSQTFARTICRSTAKAARHFALIIASWRERGREIKMADAMMAAIARANGAAVATRDVADFEGVRRGRRRSLGRRLVQGSARSDFGRLPSRVGASRRPAGQSR